MQHRANACNMGMNHTIAIAIAIGFDIQNISIAMPIPIAMAMGAWFCVTVWLCSPDFCNTMAASDLTMDDDRYNPEPYGVQYLGDLTA